MSDTEKTRAGDYVGRIADRHGFTPYFPIWDDPENADLKKQRKNPNILAPGDSVFIPDQLEQTVDRVTDRRHRFRAHIRPLKLRLVIKDVLGQRFVNATLKLKLETNDKSEALPPDGTVEVTITPKAEIGSLTVAGRDFELRVGHLQPIDTPAGVRQRLFNLGYEPGESEKPDDLQHRSAIEEFQCDHQLPVDGVVGPGTKAALQKAYGC